MVLDYLSTMIQRYEKIYAVWCGHPMDRECKNVNRMMGLSHDNRRLGSIMTKLGFEKERKGRACRRGYYVREHTQDEIERLRHPEIF